MDAMEQEVKGDTDTVVREIATVSQRKVHTRTENDAY